MRHFHVSLPCIPLPMLAGQCSVSLWLRQWGQTGHQKDGLCKVATKCKGCLMRGSGLQEEQALKSLIPDSAAVCEQALQDAGIAPNAAATAAAAALPTPAVVEVPGKPPVGPPPVPAEKLQVS